MDLTTEAVTRQPRDSADPSTASPSTEAMSPITNPMKGALIMPLRNVWSPIASGKSATKASRRRCRRKSSCTDAAENRRHVDRGSTRGRSMMSASIRGSDQDVHWLHAHHPLRASISSRIFIEPN